MAWIDEDLAQALKGLGTLLLGALGLWVSQRAGARNSRATEQSNDLAQALQPLREANEAWSSFSTPLMARLDLLEKTAGNYAERERELLERVEALEADAQLSTPLLIAYATWIQSGAPPPSPDIPDWLASRLVSMKTTVEVTKPPDEGEPATEGK